MSFLLMRAIKRCTVKQATYESEIKFEYYKISLGVGVDTYLNNVMARRDGAEDSEGGDRREAS